MLHPHSVWGVADLAFALCVLDLTSYSLDLLCPRSRAPSFHPHLITSSRLLIPFLIDYGCSSSFLGHKAKDTEKRFEILAPAGLIDRDRHSHLEKEHTGKVFLKKVTTLVDTQALTTFRVGVHAPEAHRERSSRTPWPAPQGPAGRYPSDHLAASPFEKAPKLSQ